jgi:quercetin dioxygenase-like cupin family protein
MKISRPMSVWAFLIASTLIAQDAEVTPLMSKDLAEFSGKEGLVITVVYPPGASDPIHRHNAYAFLYVLEGSIVMQLKGGKEITLAPGQTFYEGPNDIHTVGRNASSTKPAKFIVFLVKDKGAPVLVPVNATAAGVSAWPKLNSGRK